MENYECFNVTELPLSNEPELRIIQEKILNGITLTIPEARKAGRDHPVRNIDGYELKPYCAYRAINEETYNKYCELGFVSDNDPNDEYIEGKNNSGVDWFLGGASKKYGSVIIECPAYMEYFVLARDYGCHQSFDPMIRHIKSSGYKNPVPMDLVRVIKHPNIEINVEELENGFGRK